MSSLRFSLSEFQSNFRLGLGSISYCGPPGWTLSKHQEQQATGPRLIIYECLHIQHIAKCVWKLKTRLIAVSPVAVRKTLAPVMAD